MGAMRGEKGRDEVWGRVRKGAVLCEGGSNLRSELLRRGKEK
jgi:hypothetical protein